MTVTELKTSQLALQCAQYTATLSVLGLVKENKKICHATFQKLLVSSFCFCQLPLAEGIWIGEGILPLL